MIGVRMVVRQAGPILKQRMIETLSARFNCRTELDGVDVSVTHGIEVTGAGLRLFPSASMGATDPSKPLIAIDRFSFHAGLLGLFFEPMRVRLVTLTGMAIEIPPRNGPAVPNASIPRPRKLPKAKIVVDEIACDNSQLVIDSNRPDKDPKIFELGHIGLHEVGSSQPWKFEAVLTNALPKGDIHASGTFGPWNTDSPGESSIAGRYIFDHADLSTIRGIAGMLHSTGEFRGQLDRIEVDGTTETPDFSLDIADHPVPLHTQFHAIVDGTTGDTYLQPVIAKLRGSNFTTSGAVIGVKGKGHRIELDIDVTAGSVQDFLDLAVKTTPAVLTGAIAAKAHLTIPPGPQPVIDKLAIRGSFRLAGIHFTNPQVQDKVDMLSLRAQGKPKEARPGAPDVKSTMDGKFALAGGKLSFDSLDYSLPAARVDLHGVYSLDGEEFDFRGRVQTDASLPQMVDAKWASLLLRAVSPFFRGAHGGSEIPVRISGTRSAPKFGLDVLRH